MGKPLEGLAILFQTRSGDERSRDRCFRRIWEEYYPRLIVFLRGCEGAEPETRQIAFLRFHQGMRCAEIAAVMSMPMGTVKFRLHDIRRKLKLHLEEDHGDSRALRAPAL